jgi:surface antigen
MRTFLWNAPIIGAGALAVLLAAPAPLPLAAGEGGAKAIAANAAPDKTPTLAELKSHLDESDRTVALTALNMALTEIGDGVTLVWRRPERDLVGKIKPVSAFRDDKGRICRRVVYSITLGTYSREVEGVGCRESDGSWSLSG